MREIQRKRLLSSGALIAGLALALSACGGGGDTPAEETSTPAESPTTADTGGDVDYSDTNMVFASWGGTLQEAEEKAFVQPFMERTGAQVQVDGPIDYSKIKAQVESDNVTWDVVNMDPDFVEANCGTLFEELDTSIVTNLDAVDPEYVVGKCFMPSFTYGWVLYYNTEKYGDNPPASWADFFDPQKFPGKRGAWADDSSALLTAAMLADGKTPEEVYPIDLDRGFELLDKIKDDMVWAEAPGQVTEQVLSESVDLAIMYVGRAYDAAVEEVPWQVAWDAMPFVTFQGGAVLKGTKNKDASMELINQLGSIDSQNILPTLIAYGPVRPDATPDVDELQREFLMLDLPDDKKMTTDVQYWVDNQEKVDALWTDWQAG